MSETRRSAQRDMRSLLLRLDQILALLRLRSGNIAGLAVLFVALIVCFSLLLPSGFLRVTPLQAMLFQLPELDLLSLAMAIPLISGGLNLAIIATTNQAALLMAWILTAAMPHGADGGTLALWITIAMTAGLVLCLAIGLATGVIIALVEVHPILVTLGMQTLVGGVGIWLSRGKTLSGFPEPLLKVSNSTVGGVPISFLVFAIVAAATHVLLTRTALGIRIHMIGSNLEATRFSGVRTKRVQVWVYVLSSLLCWLAAVIMMARFNSAGADIAQSYLLITILAAILGGIDPYGGFGRISGLVLGGSPVARQKTLS